MAIRWGNVLIVLALLCAGAGIIAIKYTETGATWWEGPHFWSPQVVENTITTPATTYIMVVDGEEIATTTPPNDNKYQKGEDGKYRLRTEKENPAQDNLIDPPTLKVADVQEKSVWIDSDGTALPEVIKVGSQVLYLQANAMNTEFGAIVLESLVNSDDGFQKAFQSAKEESFATYLRNSEGIWGDVAGKWVDENNKYVAYLVKISTGKYGIWYTTPDTTSGNIPSNKDDLKSIVPYSAPKEESKSENPAGNNDQQQSGNESAAGGYTGRQFGK